MRTIVLLTTLLMGASLTSPTPGSAFQAPEKALFSSEEVLTFFLETDLGAVLGDRSQDSEERPATITLQTTGMGPASIPLKLRTRGRFRLQRSICPFPPLRLNFPTDGTAGSVFEGQDKLKLVTHCHRRGSYEQNVLEEYLAYRIFNLLSDTSFRVRLARITYRDSAGRRDDVTRFAFLIEDPASLADRIGGTALETPGARATDFEPGHMGILFLFEYLIGNIDWATANMQNLEAVRVGSDYLAVPYDFDWSGLVDAPYAGPSPLTERLHGSVTERLYFGVCWDQLDYSSMLAHFQDRQEAILSLADGIPGLSDANVRAARKFLAEFFDFIEDPVRAERDLKRMCKRGGLPAPA